MKRWMFCFALLGLSGVVLAQPSQTQDVASQAAKLAPGALVDHAMRMSQIEQQQEMLRKEVELMRARMEYDSLQRMAEAQDAWPKVVASFVRDGTAAALLRLADGAVVQVAVGDTLSDGVRIKRISDLGVWIEVTQGKGKKSKIQDIMLKPAMPTVAQMPGGAPFPLQPFGMSPMPAPVMPPLPAPGMPAPAMPPMPAPAFGATMPPMR